MNLFILHLYSIVFLALPLTANTQPDATLPTVFILGEHEKEYENLTLDCDQLLLQACDNDMATAHAKWRSMLKEMEAYANQIDYDLKGTKMWLHIFWKSNGAIDHIAYHLKPQSRNIKTDELTAFLTSFTNHYRFPLHADQQFSHYGAAAFPTTPQVIDDK